jgi:hypothetical protein
MLSQHEPAPLLISLAVYLVAVAFGLRALRVVDTKYKARRRADAVLRSHLSARELGHLKRFGVLEVRSSRQPERIYQVRAQSGRVLVREGGLCTMELCIRATVQLPGDEHVLAHKLMIQAAEEDYLARANVIWSRGQATVSGRMSVLD